MEATAKKISIIEWLHQSDNKFYGLDGETTNFGFGLTPTDPQIPTCCYFNVEVTQTCTNDLNGIVFLGKCRTTFRIHNKGVRPTAEFLFDLIVQAGADFAQVYYERTAGTNLAHHSISKPLFQEWKYDIRACIDIWDNSVRDAPID